MTVAFVNTSATVYAVGTSQNVAIPAVSDGDLLIATVMHRDTLTPHAGWTFVATSVGSVGATNHTVSVYKRVAQAGDSLASTTWSQATSQRIATNITAFSGDASLAVESFATFDQDDFSTDTIPIAELTATTASVGFTTGTSYLANTSNETVITPPTGWTLLSPSSVEFNRLGIAYKSLVGSELISGAYSSDFIAASNGTASVSLIISDASPAAAAANVTQLASEVLYSPPRPSANVTQASSEVLYTPPRPTAKVTQAAVEVLYSLPIPNNIQITRAAVEVVAPVVTAPDIRLTRAAIEVVASPAIPKTNQITKATGYAILQRIDPAGVSIKKATGYAILQAIPPNLDVAKATAYAILKEKPGVPKVTKATAYAVLRESPVRGRVSKATAYVVLREYDKTKQLNVKKISLTAVLKPV